MDLNPLRCIEIESFDWPIILTGAGSSNPTLTLGKYVTPTRTATGTYKLTFIENPFAYLGATYSLLDATMANLAGFTVVFGAYTAATSTAKAFLTFTVYNASQAATDLTSAMVIYLSLKFMKATSTL